MVSAPLAEDPAGVSDMVTVWRPRGAGSSLLCGGDPRMLAQERGQDVRAVAPARGCGCRAASRRRRPARRRRDGDAVQLGSVAGEDAFLDRRRRARVPEALLVRGRDLERPERRDLVLRRAVPDRVGAPQDASGPNATSSLPSTCAACVGSPIRMRHVEPSSA